MIKIHPKSIAVLPFVNRSAGEAYEYFSDGITEEIINALAKIKQLRVTSRTSSFYFKNKKIPLPEIGHVLGVATVLEGSVRLAANKIRISAQLIDVAEDIHFWSATFDRSIDDLFAVQDEVSLLIADKLREYIGHLELEENLLPPPNLTVDLYKDYLKGRYHLMKLGLKETEKAIDIFKSITAIRPDFTPAYLGINQGYAFLGTMGLIPAQEAFTKAQPYLEKAIKLDKEMAEVQLNLAWICCWQNWDLTGAYRHVNQALEIRPSDEIYLTIANFFTVEGKLKAAFTYIDKALELDPLSAMNHHYKGFLYYLSEDYEKALPQLKKSLRLNADLPFPPLYIGSSLVLMGRPAEGLAYFQQLPERKTGYLTRLGGSTLAYAALGDEENTADGITKLEAALKTDVMGAALNFLILVHGLKGAHETAIDYIVQGIGNRLPGMLLLYTEPLVKPLRPHPRFQDLMRQALGENTKMEFSSRKYKKPLFDAKVLNQYKTLLEQLMKVEQPYLDADLSLRSLAAMIDIPPNHLSQLLNEGFDRNFAEYINFYRLDTFKAKVANPKLQGLTILALAYESGFNSKTAFNTFFKKAMGITPKMYWKKVVQN